MYNSLPRVPAYSPIQIPLPPSPQGPVPHEDQSPSTIPLPHSPIPLPRSPEPHSPIEISLPCSPYDSLNCSPQKPSAQSIAAELYSLISNHAKSSQMAELQKAIPEMPTIKRTQLMSHFNTNKIQLSYSTRAERSLWQNNIDRLTFMRLIYEKTEQIKQFNDYCSFVRHTLTQSLEIILRKQGPSNMGFLQIHVVDIISHNLHTQLNKYSTLLASCANDYEVVISHLAHLRAKAAVKKELALRNIRERIHPTMEKDVIYINYNSADL